MLLLVYCFLFLSLTLSAEESAANCIEHRENSSLPDARHTIYCSPDDDSLTKPPGLLGSVKFFRWNWELNDMEPIRKTSPLNRKKLIIMIHGFTGSADVWRSLPHRNLLGGLQYASPSSDIVLVDWQDGASPWGGNWDLMKLGDLYSTPARNTKAVGLAVARFLESRSSDIELSTMHCIGFSLGAHACGFVGKALKKGRLGRITGLDPAGPGFDTPMASDRLDASDAKFVDVVHSSDLGILRAIGHVDFYVNDPTTSQPNCKEKASIPVRPKAVSPLPDGLISQASTVEINNNRPHRPMKRNTAYNIFRHIFTNVITGITISNHDDMLSYFTGGAHLLGRNNSASLGTVAVAALGATAKNAGRAAINKYEEGSGNVCSHYLAIELFAASCVPSCSIKYCACLSFVSTQHRDLFQSRIRSNCTQLKCAYFYKNLPFGYNAIPPTDEDERYLHGGDSCGAASLTPPQNIVSNNNPSWNSQQPATFH